MWTWEGLGMQKWSSHFAHWCLLLVKGSRPRLRLQWIPVHFHFCLLGVQLSFSAADPSCPAVTPGPPQALSHQLWGSSQEEQTPFPWGLHLPPSHTYSSSWKSPTSRLPWELWLIILCWGWFIVFLLKSILPPVPLVTVYALTAEVHSLLHNTHKGLHPRLDPEWCLPGKPLNQKPLSQIKDKEESECGAKRISKLRDTAVTYMHVCSVVTNSLWLHELQPPWAFSGKNIGVGCHFLDFPNPGIEPPSLESPALAGGFFITSTTSEAHPVCLPPSIPPVSWWTPCAPQRTLTCCWPSSWDMESCHLTHAWESCRRESR